ncbi:MAG: bifunctional 5,10-methylenetetrahydrofolate dehydrogenase/5,10-methenyltetrahydrofolate cyclohydrolase [Candidatus Paceibacterota bacterium]|jgi:methylenetetrahydrofolate dehydrogenase (NADP+)/methenyltetrahydrofolate cyclohydrolase
MIIDGRQIAEDIKKELKEKLIGRNLKLAIVSVGDDIVSAKYLSRKQKFGEAVGVETIVYKFADDVSEDGLVEQLHKLANDGSINGIVVQLPLPKHLATEKLLALIPSEKDVDALTSEARVLPPVVAAIKEILTRNQVSIEGKRAVVVGRGRLVGKPAALWLTQNGAIVEIVDLATKNSTTIIAQADLIVSGAGKPGLLKVGMLKEGVVLIDAATSEAEGRLLGDAEPACALRCSIFTPVPGGVGPLTIACLFKNLAELN